MKEEKKVKREKNTTLTSKKSLTLKNKRKVVFFSIFKNLTIKVISISLALILFLYVQYTSNLTIVVEVPVVAPELPKKLIFSRKIPAFLKVSFYGKTDKMDFDTSHFQILLDNPNPISGSNLYVTSLSSDPPSGVKASFIGEILLNIDHIASRELSVVPKINAELPKGKSLGYVNSNPRTVRLEGAFETLSNMSHVETEVLEVKKVDHIISQRVLIQKLPDFVSFAEKQTFQVELTINVLDEKEKNYKVIENVSIECLNSMSNIKMQIAGKSKVTLYLSTEAKLKKGVKAFVFCPIFYDKNKKELRPSFLIQNQPIFFTENSNVDIAYILKIDPSEVNLEFEWTGTKD